MGNCDLCYYTPLTADAVRYAPIQIQKAVNAGLYPPEKTLEAMGATLGMTPEETYNRWFQRSANTTNEWALCPGCASRVEPFLIPAPPPLVSVPAYPQPVAPPVYAPFPEPSPIPVAAYPPPPVYSPYTEPPPYQEPAPYQAPFPIPVAPPVPEIAAPPPVTARVKSLRSNANFPNVLHWSLVWPETRVRSRSALVGLVLGIVLSLLVALIAKKGGMLSQMFNLRSIATLIPVSILCMFFWAVAICILRGMRLRELERISGKGLLLHATRFLAGMGVSELAQELEAKGCETSPLLRRLQAVARQWALRPRLQDADLVLQQHIANDDESVRAGYSLVRTFIWALPVLGLIGTVIGISLAVGGFAQFLGGDIEDVALIKQNLVGVTGGLSFAFLITLEGLLTALIVMLAASSLQNREEKLYANVQQDIADIFLPQLQEVAPETALTAAGPGDDRRESEAWRATLEQVANGVLAVVKEGCAQMISDLKTSAEKQQQHAAEVANSAVVAVKGAYTQVLNDLETRVAAQRQQGAEWVQLLHDETEKSAQRLVASLDRTGGWLTSSNQELLSQFSLVSRVLEAQTGKMATLVEAQSQATAQQHAVTTQAVGQHINGLQAVSAQLAGLAETTNHALAHQTELRAAMQQFNDSNLEPTLARLATELATHHQETRATAQALSGVVTATQEVLQSQATLQRAVSQLHETGLEQTLGDFRDALVSLRPTLASFREPFVLQAVPVRRAAEENFEKVAVQG